MNDQQKIERLCQIFDQYDSHDRSGFAIPAPAPEKLLEILEAVSPIIPEVCREHFLAQYRGAEELLVDCNGDGEKRLLCFGMNYRGRKGWNPLELNRLMYFEVCEEGDVGSYELEIRKDEFIRRINQHFTKEDLFVFDPA